MITIYEGITLMLLLAGVVLIIWSFIISKETDQQTNISDLENYEEYQSRVDEINQNIIELNEYSEFAKSELDVKHKELLFLYQLINEKVKELEIYKSGNGITSNTVIETQISSINQDAERANYHSKHHMENHNKRIIELSEQGYPTAEIAKMLDIGQGQVKLVLNLYK
jgi:hypothetical protein